MRRPTSASVGLDPYSICAIISNMRYGHLSRRLHAWVEAGLISEEQADAIRGHEESAAHRERRGFAIQTLAYVGAIVAGLGVILFFAANWDAIPRPTRVLA